MTDLPSLIQAAVADTGEHTPVHLLADWWLEQGDGRGELLRKWLEGKQQVRTPMGVRGHPTYHWEPADETGKGVGSMVGKESVVGTDMDGSRHQVPLFSLYLKSDGLWRNFHLKVPDPTEARALADRLPNADSVHAFLNEHWPSKLPAELNRVLKPEE